VKVEGGAVDVVNPMVRRMRQEARIDPDGFWAKEAERLPWFRTWSSTIEDEGSVEEAREAWAEMVKEVGADGQS
jgi:hypothetical protein